MNKKAMMDDLFDFLFTVMAAFFVLFFINMFLVGGVEKSEKVTLSEMRAVEAKTNLLTYLKSPISDTENMADLIVLWHYDQQKYEDKLKGESEKILKELPVPLPAVGWNVRLFFPDGKEKMHIETANIIGWYENRNRFFFIPLPEEDKYLKVEIYLECQDVRCR